MDLLPILSIPEAFSTSKERQPRPETLGRDLLFMEDQGERMLVLQAWKRR
jgi:hypothetical protein